MDLRPPAASCPTRYARPFTPGFGDQPSAVEYGDGDGSINIESAMMPQARWPESGAGNYSFRYLHGVSHFGIVREEEVLREVMEVMGVPEVQSGWGLGWAAVGFGGALGALRWVAGGAVPIVLL
jgi:hypothetical protein